MNENSETSDTRRSYDTVAERYAIEIADELRGKPLDRALLAVLVELADHGLIIDAGCGPGHATAHLSMNNARLLGMDLSPMMSALAARTTSLPFCAADMTAMPIRSQAAAAIVSLYSVIHLNTAQRTAAYKEFARVLRPGGHALIGFHTSDDAVPQRGFSTLTSWWGHEVCLTFRFLDPADEVDALAAEGFDLVARLDRAPVPEIEHPSRRSYLLVRRSQEHRRARLVSTLTSDGVA